MKVTALQPAIICFFSVLIQIQSTEIEYIYNYDDFSEIFEQGGQHNFNVAKYQDIDNIFDKPYEGSNIGGAFLLYGKWLSGSWHQQEFVGYIIKITTTHYCGKLNAPLKLWINYADGSEDSKEICSDTTGWNYNYAWIPTRHTESFTLGISAEGATVNEPFGFDEIRITVTDAKTTKKTARRQQDNNKAPATSENPATAPKKSP